MNKNTIIIVVIFIVVLGGCKTKQEEKAPLIADEITSGFLVSTEEVETLSDHQDVVIIDARDAEEYRKLHIPGSINIPKETFREPEDLDYKSEYGFLTLPEKAEKV